MAVSPESVASIRGARVVQRVDAWARWARAEVVLGAMILLSIAGRIVAAVPHRTARYFPDEYIYASLARSIAHGQLAIRGTAVHFPALLAPLLAAPLTLFAGVETAYRLTQGLNAVAASLAAIPVFLIARRLALPSWQCLLCAAFTLAVPELVYTSYVTADAIALPLALAAVYAGMRALEQPTRRSQVVFLLFMGLAVFARVQYAVLPVAVLIAAAVRERGRVLQVARNYRLLLLVLGAPVLIALAVGPGRVLGYYHGVLDLGVPPSSVAKWIASDAMMLVLACGATLVPAALVGLVLGLARPGSDTEHAFAAFAAALTPLVLFELAAYAANGAERFQGRYLEVLPPLLPLLFCLGMRRATGSGGRVAIGLLSLGALLLSAVVPLAGYAEGLGVQDSPFLQAVRVVEEHAGTANGSLLFAGATGLCALAAGLAAWRPRVGAGVVLVLAVAFVTSTSVAATNYDSDRSARAMRTYFPDDVRWVDHSGLRDVAVLETPGSPRGSISGTLFWNTSATRILQMQGAEDVDAFGAAKTRIRRDGVILADGMPYRGPLLVEEYAAYAELDGATLVNRNVSTSLWRSTGTPRLVSFTNGRYLDGWLAWQTSVTVWPGASGHRSGALCMTLSMPSGAGTTVQLRGPGLRRAVRVPAGASRRVAVPLSIDAPWLLRLTVHRPVTVGDGRLLAAQSSPPHFVEGKASAAACR